MREKKRCSAESVSNNCHIVFKICIIIYRNVRKLLPRSKATTVLKSKCMCGISGCMNQASVNLSTMFLYFVLKA